MDPKELYAKLYAQMVCAASEAIDLIEAGNGAAATACLRTALTTAEEIYLAAGE